MNMMKATLKMLISGTFLIVSGVIASVPEPANIVHGYVYSINPETGEKVVANQQGLMIRAKKGPVEISQAETSAQGYFSLAIPIEADIGQQETDVARVNDQVSLYVSGQVEAVSTITISGRGEIIRKDLATTQLLDSDGDGIPDIYEPGTANDPTQPLAYGGAADIDGDGVSNAMEYLTGSYDPLGDYDGDGFRNQDEYRLESNPADEHDFPINHVITGAHAVTEISRVNNRLKQQSSVWVADANWGQVRSVTPVFWHLNKSVDLLIAADQLHLIKLEYSNSDDELRLADDGIISDVYLSGLPRLSSLEDYHFGYSDLTGDKILELWVHTSTGDPATDEILIYKREAEDQPFGGSHPWQKLIGVPFVAASEFKDVDGDDIADFIYLDALKASDKDYYAGNNKVVRYRKGRWDGENYRLDDQIERYGMHVVSSEYQALSFVDNIQEAGFDHEADLILDSVNWQQILLPSAFRYAGHRLNGVAEKDGVLINFNEFSSDSVRPILYHAYSLYIDANGDGVRDMLRLQSEPEGFSLLLYKGKHLVDDSGAPLDTDGDGIVDISDISKTVKSIPIINGENSGEIDSDNDGMSDEFEARYGLNGLVNDADSDIDSDGFTNIQEYQNGTNPVITDVPVGRDLNLLAQKQVYTGAAISAVVFYEQFLIIASDQSKKITILSAATLEEVANIELTFSDAGVTQLLAINDQLIVGGTSGTLSQWNIQDQTQIGLDVDVIQGSVLSLASYDGKLLAADATGKVHQWDLLSPISNHSVQVVGDSPVSYVQANNQYLVTQTTAETKQVAIWNRSNSSLRYAINGGRTLSNGEPDEKYSITAGDSERLVLAQHFDSQKIYLMQIADSSSRVLLDNQQATSVSAMKLSSNNLFIGYQNGVLQQISTNNDSIRATKTTSGATVRALDVSGNKLVSAHADGKIYVWSIANED